MPFSITTQRLRLRPWQDADRASLERMARDSDMMHFLTDGRPWRDDEVDEFLERQALHLATHGVCMGPAELIATGEVVGMAGLQPLDDGTFELGWWIWKAHWKLGLATEAAARLVEYARDTMALDRLAAVIDEHNLASRRVAEKIGMRLEGIRSARETNARRPDLPIAFYTMRLETHAADYRPRQAVDAQGTTHVEKEKPPSRFRDRGF